MKALLIPVPAMLALASCQAEDSTQTDQIASASLQLADGTPVGTAELIGSGEALTLSISVTDLEPGSHGFHLHMTGACVQPDFKSAGGHLNPDGEGHGLEDDDGSHLGDLPNLVVAENGKADAVAELKGPRIQRLPQIFDADGTAIVIHADPDDGTSEPSGNAGSRVACGVLTQN